jgi:hypothetical protein
VIDEAVRAAVGLPVALLWPLGVPRLAHSPVGRAVASGLTAALVLGRELPGLEAFALVLAVAAAAAVVLAAGGTADALRDAVRSDDVVVVALGALAVGPVTGALLAWALAPLAARLAADPDVPALPGLLRAGMLIGWCERALVYVFLLAGEPSAAALALTAKSVARFPAFASGHESLAEYVLIGTLASFLGATVVAIGVRALLGLPAL